MGMLFRKGYTMPVPSGAEIVERDGKRIARWRLRNGQQRSAEVVDCADGKLRVRGQSQFFIARYRDGTGRVVDVPTNCREAVAARRVLADLERRAELVRGGVLTQEEDDAVAYAAQPLSKHLDAYVRYLKAKGGDPRRISMLRSRLERLFRECRLTRLNRLTAGPVEHWLADQAEAGVSAATRNCYRESAVCFGNWCRRSRRLTNSPFGDLPRADQNADRRHQRRALTELEITRLLNVACLRPLADYGRQVMPAENNANLSPRSRATWKREPLSFENIEEAVERAREALKGNPDLIAQLKRTGHERSLIYKTLVLTGLRKGELASLTVGQLELAGQVAYAVLYAADEKNRQGSNIPLRADLAAEISSWLDERLVAIQDEARSRRQPIPMRLPATTPLFSVPTGLARILDRDLAVAGIPKRDERNRVIDVHALRVTFGTHLCAAGVPLRTAQAAMRHSKPELTANVYTDPKLLDVAGAIDALPALPHVTSTTSAGANAINELPATRRRATS